jgi:dsRNA-specific ribonuclease
MIALSDKEPTT